MSESESDGAAIDGARLGVKIVDDVEKIKAKFELTQLLRQSRCADFIPSSLLN